MKFRFPIVIIDEDYRSENTSGLGIRALAQAIDADRGTVRKHLARFLDRFAGEDPDRT